MHKQSDQVCTPDTMADFCAPISAAETVADVRQHQVAAMRAAYLRGLAHRIEAGLPVAGMLAGIDWQHNANFNSFKAVLDQLADPAMNPETIGNHLQKRALSECPQAASNLMALAALAGTISEFPGANS
jgi:hypothetical protein